MLWWFEVDKLRLDSDEPRLDRHRAGAYSVVFLVRRFSTPWSWSINRVSIWANAAIMRSVSVIGGRLPLG